MAVIGTFAFPNLIINHAELNGKSILSNGLEAMRKYNPVTGQLLPAVLRPFRQNVALTSGAAGNLSGTYVYRVVPYNQNEDEEGEAYPGDANVAAYSITVLNKRVVINRTNLRRDSPEITHWRIYRTVGDGSWPVLARVATVVWATTTYTDNVADGTLDFTAQPLDVLIKVPTPKPFLCVHRSRVFAWGDIPYSDGQVQVQNGSATVIPTGGAVFGFHLEGKEFHADGDGRSYIVDQYDPPTGRISLTATYGGTTRTCDYRICGDADTLIWSEPYFEHQWPLINNHPINKKEDDKPAGMMPAGGCLILAKSRKSYVLNYNNTPAIPYGTLSVLSEDYGCISHRSMRSVEGVPVWMCDEGLVQANGESVRLVSRDMGDYFRDNLRLDATGDQQMACAVEFRRKGQYICFFPDRDSVLGCNRAVVWHFREQKFSIYTFGTEFSCAETVKNLAGEEIAVLGDVLGYLWEFPSGKADGPGDNLNTTIEGAVDEYGEGSPCYLFDADAMFVPSGLGLAGMPIYIYEGTGAGQVGVIAGNTADTLFLEECFETPLDETSRYYIGGIHARYRSGWLDFGTVDRAKMLQYAHLVFEKQAAGELRFNFYEDFGTTPTDLRDTNFRTPVEDREDAGLVPLADDDEDTAHPRGRHRIPLGGVRRTHVAWELVDDRPRNPWSIYDVAFDFQFKEP